MQQQLSFAQAEFQAKKKVMSAPRALSWRDGADRSVGGAAGGTAPAHYYPKAGRAPGRPPIALERMLRMYFLQQCCTLADEALGDGIYDG